MTEELKQKLHSIVRNFGNLSIARGEGVPTLPDVNEAIEQITQAFIDDGWVNAKINNTHDPLYLTGAEWYDRFKKELDDLHTVVEWNIPYKNYEDALDAAKKAAGLDTEASNG